jgi:hypothetical protein
LTWKKVAIGWNKKYIIESECFGFYFVHAEV